MSHETDAEQPPASEERVVEKPVSLRRFLTDTVVYGLVDVTDKAIGFVLLPLTTYALTRDDYGILSIFGNSSGVLFLFYSVGMLNGFYRFYTATDRPNEQHSIFNTAVWTIAVSSLLWSVGMFLLAAQLDRWLFRGDGTGYIWMLGVNTFLQCLESLGGARLQADGRPWIFFMVSTTRTLFTRGIGLTLILQGYGAWGWIIGELLGLCVTFILMLFNGLRGIAPTYDTRAAREMVPYSASLVPAAMSHWIMTSSDTYLIKFLGALSDVGLYGVGQRISSIMQLINTAFILGWRRFAFKNIHHEEGPRLLARGVTLFSLAGGYGALALALLGDDLTYWVIDPKFHAGMVVIAPLTFATVTWGWSDIASIGLHKAKRTMVLSWVNIMAAILNIELDLVLIPIYGIAGAAVATLAAQVTKTVLIWYCSQKAFPIPFEYRRLFTAGTIFLGVFFAGDYVGSWMIAQWPGHAGWLRAGCSQVVLLLAAPVLLGCFGFFRAEELELIRNVATRWRRWLPIRTAPPQA